MSFPKDILLIDFETTGYGVADAAPTEVGAVLLDKESLTEKDSFSSYIHADVSGLDKAAIEKWRIPVDDILKAPSIEQVTQEFIDRFGFSVILSSWVQRLDKAMLQKMLVSVQCSTESYDYHYLDLWPAAYLYLCKGGYEGDMDSESMFQAFGFPPRGAHRALEDARIAAEILRKLFA